MGSVKNFGQLGADSPSRRGAESKPRGNRMPTTRQTANNKPLQYEQGQYMRALALTTNTAFRNTFRLGLISLAAIVGLSGSAAAAGTGVYTISGLMNGSFNGTTFSGKQVTFTLIGSTDNISTPAGGEFLNPLTSTTVTLGGIGSFTLLDTTELGGLIGGQETAFDQFEPQPGKLPQLRNLLIWSNSTALDLTHSFGPLLSGDFTEVIHDVIPTSGGDLLLDLSEGPLPSLTFSGVVTGGVPEPATWALLLTGFGITGFAARRRRGLSVVTA